MSPSKVDVVPIKERTPSVVDGGTNFNVSSYFDGGCSGADPPSMVDLVFVSSGGVFGGESGGVVSFVDYPFGECGSTRVAV